MAHPAPIAPHPDWRPPQGQRETLQGQLVRNFKEEVWDAKEIIRFYAGTPNKPPMYVAGARQKVTAFMGKLDQLEQAHRLDAGRVAAFRRFAQVWQDGNGSWTDSKKLIEGTEPPAG